jgi:hypothetical protein
MSATWKNTGLKEFPYHGQTVIVNIEGVYHVAVYYSTTKNFVMKSEPFKAFSCKEENIKWTDHKL